MDDDAKRRLAKVQDPEMRKLLADLYPYAMQNETSERFRARERFREATKAKEEIDWAHALTASALRGVFGKAPQDLANKYTLQGTVLDDEACMAVASEVCKLDQEDRRRVKD